MRRSHVSLLAVSLSAVVLAFCLAVPGVVRGEKSGVDPTRVKLPQGPGSLQGIGENADLQGNMGLVGYRVPLQLPQGYHGAVPDLALVYNSGSGNGVAGMGWSLPLMTLERMTARGLPRYVPDDTFVGAYGEELVTLAPASSVYRARHEKHFVRYTWLGKAADEW